MDPTWMDGWVERRASLGGSISNQGPVIGEKSGFRLQEPAHVGLWRLLSSYNEPGPPAWARFLKTGLGILKHNNRCAQSHTHSPERLRSFAKRNTRLKSIQTADDVWPHIPGEMTGKAAGPGSNSSSGHTWPPEVSLPPSALDTHFDQSNTACFFTSYTSKSDALLVSCQPVTRSPFCSPPAPQTPFHR